MRIQERDTLKYLFVLAHPDDEADLGGTIWTLSQNGHEVAVAITVGKAAARRNLSNTLEDEEAQSMSLLGVLRTYHADFPNIKLNVVAHSDIVSFINNCIDSWKPEAIVTHHTADLNVDHAITGLATISACRQYYHEYNRQLKLRLFLMCETAGATEWAINSSLNRFEPNYYVEIGNAGLEIKLKAHEFYRGVMREFPHPQSYCVYEGLAAYRGAQSGYEYAEAYQCVFAAI